jgi:hypothetical protein
MLLRDHPLMSYKGRKHPRGEVGILKRVVLSNINEHVEGGVTSRCDWFVKSGFRGACGRQRQRTDVSYTLITNNQPISAAF